MGAKKWPEVKRFRPTNPNKYIGDINKIETRSSWEIKFCSWCDKNPSVIQWNSEGVHIPYWSEPDQKQRTYHVDFLINIKTSDGSVKTLLVEIKPYSQTIKPVMKRGKKTQAFINETYTYEVNMSKWIHAKKYALDRGWDFVVMTENELYGKKP